MTEPALSIDPQFTLSRLLEGIVAAPAIPITGIATDSRSLKRGQVFLACRGGTRHGLAFAAQAISAGAAAIVSDGDPDAPATGPLPVPLVEVPGLGRRLGEIANRWFDAPSRHLLVAGVTGTNGKTTVAWLLAQCLERIGRPCGYVGTLGAGLGKLDGEPGLTTPPCIELHETLADFRAQGAGHAALEVSSHGLQQNRLDGVQFDSALFTNLSRDHIDYHGDMRRYGEIKAGFVLDERIARHIVNIDDPFGAELAQRIPGRRRGALTVTSTGATRTDDYASFVRLRVVTRDEAGTSVEALTSWGDVAFHLPLVGHFNVANGALVLAQLLCWGIPLGAAAGALREAVPPPGRLQRVPAAAGQPAVYVDYAHTPAGLEAVLGALRPHCAGALWCVFGCGGDRDRGKRRSMGETVATLADRAVVTSDNPRSEPPGDIIAEILRGMPGDAIVLEDRGEAIAHAIAAARPEDVVLIAGKGHETVQVIGDRRLPFSDYAVARDCLATRNAAGEDRR